MILLRRSFLLAASFTGSVFALAQEPKKVVPATPLVPVQAKKAEDKKAEEKKVPETAPLDPYAEFLKQQEQARAEADKLASHKTVKEVSVRSKDGKLGLQTMTVDVDGRILALVAPPKPFGAPVKNAVSEIHVLDKDGKETGIWTVNFHATAINVGPDGTAYVGGDGKIARFGKDGKPLGEPLALPMIAEALKDTAGMKAKAEKQVQAQKDSFAASTKRFKEQLEKLEAKKPEDLTKTEQAQMKTFKQILESQKETAKYYESMTVESVLEGMLSRVRVINGLCANTKDVFVACGETEGYGFAIWRLDSDLKNPKKVLSNVTGCCGQMDIQCCEADLLVAENTKHRFAKYDRDGKELIAGGKRGKETEPGCFGGCCNPMNVRACGGDIFTAESEGIVKKFSSTGEFLNIVGTVKIGGGCKNVAIGATKDGKSVYFCDQPGSKVFIMTEKPAK